MTDNNAPAPVPGEDEPLSLEQQLEQVEEAAEAVAEAIEQNDHARAAAILEQLETWRQNLSSTLSEAKASQANNPQLTEALEEIRGLRSEVDALKTPPKPSASPTPSDPPQPTPPASEPQTPTPHSDASPMEPPESVAPVEQVETPPSPRQQRRAI